MSLTVAKTTTGHEVPAIVTPDGVTRLLTAMTGGDRKKAIAPYAAANPVIPRSEWSPTKRPRGSVPIMNQGSHGSCVGHGSGRALMKGRDAAGMQFVALSPTFIYAQINGGFDAGANLGDAADELRQTGTCTMQEVGEDMVFKRQIGQSAYQTAQRFKALKVYACSSFDEVVSAWLLGGAIFDSTRCGRNYNNLNSDGVPGMSRGPGNHCVSVADELKKSAGGDWLLEHANSWGTDWGLGGYMFFGEENYDIQPGWEAYVIMAVATDPQDPTIVPAA